MAVSLQEFGLDQLSAEDRLELLALLWDSLSHEPFTPPDWHIRELERRLAAAEADPAASEPWEVIKARARK